LRRARFKDPKASPLNRFDAIARVVEIQAQQLSADQQPSVGKVAVRDSVSCSSGIDQ
jgi:hypothetical protein